jgi:hypothetical protein
VPNRHHPHRLTEPDKISSENKVQNSGVFFRRKKPTIKTPRFTSNSPQIHHKKTTPKTPNFLKTPCKNSPSTAPKKYGPAKSRTVFQPYKSTQLTRRRE